MNSLNDIIGKFKGESWGYAHLTASMRRVDGKMCDYLQDNHACKPVFVSVTNQFYSWSNPHLNRGLFDFG